MTLTRRPRPEMSLALGPLLALAMALALAACGSAASSAPGRSGAHRSTGTQPVARSAPASATTTARPPASSTPTTSTPTTSAPTTRAPPTTAPPPPPTTTAPPAPAPAQLPPAGPGFVAGHVTAVGDSVMLDYQAALEADAPGVDVEAAVSRQWSDGEAVLQQLRSAGRLGAVVVVGLGTNGPITSADFDTMMSILSGASRVVFVNVVVDRPWQNGNNAVLAAGVASHPGAVLADWASLEAGNPGWVYSDGTHLPINGPGAQALAGLVASKL